LVDAFGLTGRRSVYLIGGGGKTSLMFACAHGLVEQGRTVVTTTSTKIGQPSAMRSAHVLVNPDIDFLLGHIASDIGLQRHITVAAARLEPGKLVGLSVAQLDQLVDSGVADHVLVEADGAAGRSLKAHRDHEPVVSPRAELVIAVIGIDCIGKPMNDQYVHRSALLRERLDRTETDLVTVEDVARIFFCRDGYLAKVGGRSEIMVFINKAATGAQVDLAGGLGDALRLADKDRRIGSVVIGDVGQAAQFGKSLSPHKNTR